MQLRSISLDELANIIEQTPNAKIFETPGMIIRHAWHPELEGCCLTVQSAAGESVLITDGSAPF